ncbi:MAG: 3-oxoacyl-ACP reductase [Rhizobiales bacterium 12-66-7]|nr:MAG: 3-oxoacyl-ACP reductase [Rhizobiales bacterium 12-66-7]
MFDFTGKTLFLTGANGGISRAVAQTFFECGANCVLTDLDAEGMEAFARTLDPSGARVVATRQDAADPDDADRALALAKERFGALDFLVTSAGLYRARQVAEMDDAYWRQGIAVNLDGVFYTCRRAIPLLADGAAIVNLASMAGHRGSFAHADYSAAKGAVLAFSRSLAIELAPRVRVNAVSPGLIDTPMISNCLCMTVGALTSLKSKEMKQSLAAIQPEIVVTGETVHVNGGLYIAS